MPTDKPTNLERKVKKYIKAKEAYYAGTPSMSDAAFDKLENEIRAEDPNNPALKMVGTKKRVVKATVTAAGEILHDPPMLSAQKIKDVAEAVKWVEGKEVVWGYKIDGNSIELDYRRGILTTISTRGDGIHGEDVTRGAMAMLDVPRKLPVDRDVKVRGEAYIRISDFNKINELETDKFKSPRNLAAGTLASNDPKTTASRRLRFMAWDVIAPIPIMKKISNLKSWGFYTADVGILDTDVENLFTKITAKRANFDYEMDGILFKVNDPKVQEEMGSTGHHPRWMAALKFVAEQDSTTLTSISWQVGRTRKITPRANFDVITLAGADIEHATMHNARFVKNNRIGIGDKLFIVRSGDVIPKVTGVAKSANNPAPIPRTCPVCSMPTAWNETGVEIFCTNEDCGESGIQGILHFLKTTSIEGIGPKSVRQMWADGKLKKPVHLYKLAPAYLTTTFGVNGQKMHDNIVKAKNLPLDVFLDALGIHGLGTNASRKIASRARGVDDLTPALIDEIFGSTSKAAASIKPALAKQPWKPFVAAGVVIGVGEVKKIKSSEIKPIEPKKPVAKQKTLTEMASRTVVNPRPSKEAGIAKPSKPISAKQKTLDEPVAVKAGSGLAGKSVYVTGSVEGFTKQQLEDFIVANDMVWKELSLSLDYLVKGQSGVGKAKLDKIDKWREEGKKTNVKVLEWDAFMGLLQSNKARPMHEWELKSRPGEIPQRYEMRGDRGEMFHATIRQIRDNSYEMVKTKTIKGSKPEVIAHDAYPTLERARVGLHATRNFTK